MVEWYSIVEVNSKMYTFDMLDNLAPLQFRRCLKYYKGTTWNDIGSAGNHLYLALRIAF